MHKASFISFLSKFKLYFVWFLLALFGCRKALKTEENNCMIGFQSSLTFCYPVCRANLPKYIKVTCTKSSNQNRMTSNKSLYIYVEHRRRLTKFTWTTFRVYYRWGRKIENWHFSKLSLPDNYHYTQTEILKDNVGERLYIIWYHDSQIFIQIYFPT